MLNSKLFAGLGGLLILASPVFPQHAPGFLIAGGMSGAATWVVAEKEREVSRRNAELTERDRSLKSNENRVGCLIEKYERSLTEIERKQTELAALQSELDKQRVRCAFIESLRPQLEKRERELETFKAELDRIATEQRERRTFLDGWSEELDQAESKNRADREKIIAWNKDLEYQTADLNRQKREVEQNRENFSEMLKAYQLQVWEELKPQAQAYAESIIAERQKPLDKWKEELKATEQALDSVIPGLKSELEKEVERIETQWKEWAKNYQEECNGKIKAALDDRNSAHDTWKNHYMALAGKTHEENQQLRKVVYSPGRHWYEMQADRIIEFLNFNEISVDYYQSLPTPDEKGFYVEVEPKYGKEALPEVYTKLCTAGMKEALKGIVTDCKQKPGVEVASKRIKLTFVMSSPAYVSELQKASGMAAKSQRKDDFLNFLSQVAQVAILGVSGDGKSTLLANIVGAYAKELGGDTTLIITNPKPSAGSRDLGIAKYSGLEKSIFGLLDAAVEISYRIKLNEIAEAENPENPTYPDHKPIIYLLDEYSEIGGKWNSVKEKRMNSVVAEFNETLDEERQEVLKELMEDATCGTFASSLLKTVWRLGRSEKVRVIIAGQNLMASTLGCHKQDIWNPAFIILGDLIEWGIKNRTLGFQQAELNEAFREKVEAGQQDPANNFYGLFCAPRTKPFFLNLPAPNQYKFNQTKTVQKQLEDLYRRSPEVTQLNENGEGSATEVPPESLPDEGCRSGDTSDGQDAGTQGSAKIEGGVPSGTLSDKDVERLNLIEQLREEGKTTLKEVIAAVWADIPGVEKYKSRTWQKAREEYRRLTGK